MQTRRAHFPVLGARYSALGVRPAPVPGIGNQVLDTRHLVSGTW